MAADVTVPETLTNGGVNDATKVMTDFTTLRDWINTNAVHLDGAKATTGILSGPGTDPTTANQYTRKSYVDATSANRARFGCRARRNAAQAYSSEQAAAISFDTEDWDTGGFFAPTSTNVVIPTGGAGVYLVSAGTTSTNVADLVEVRKNGATVIPLGSVFGAVNYRGSGLLLLAAADVLTLYVDNGASAINYTGFLDIQRVSL